jgi:hypothetical protein
MKTYETLHLRILSIVKITEHLHRKIVKFYENIRSIMLTESYVT